MGWLANDISALLLTMMMDEEGKVLTDTDFTRRGNRLSGYFRTEKYTPSVICRETA